MVKQEKNLYTSQKKTIKKVTNKVIKKTAT